MGKTEQITDLVAQGRVAEGAYVWKYSTVIEVTGISRSSLWRLIKRENFPRPIKLGAGSVGFISGEVMSWIKSRPRV